MVEEDEAAGPQKDSRQLLAKFNTQMEKLYDLLRAVENIQLAPVVLEPEPEELGSGTKSNRNQGKAAPPPGGEGRFK